MKKLFYILLISILASCSKADIVDPPMSIAIAYPGTPTVAVSPNERDTLIIKTDLDGYMVTNYRSKEIVASGKYSFESENVGFGEIKPPNIKSTIAYADKDNIIVTLNAFYQATQTVKIKLISINLNSKKDIIDSSILNKNNIYGIPFSRTWFNGSVLIIYNELHGNSIISKAICIDKDLNQIFTSQLNNPYFPSANYVVNNYEYILLQLGVISKYSFLKRDPIWQIDLFKNHGQQVKINKETVTKDGNILNIEEDYTNYDGSKETGTYKIDITTGKLL